MPLFGRELELVAVERAGRGDAPGALIFVEGHPGSGKSSVLDAAAARVRERGTLVLHARGQELEQELEFGVVQQLFEQLFSGMRPANRKRILDGPAAAAAVALGPPWATAPAQAPLPSEASIIRALLRLTADVAASGPLLLVVDDAHWADAASLRFLDLLAARLDALTVGVVLAASHTTPDGSMLARLRLRAGASVVRMRPLELESTAAVIRERFGQEPDPGFAAACLQVSGGNPFLLRELLNAAAEARLVPDAGAAQRVTEFGPVAVARELALRLAPLGSAATRVTEALAVLGPDGDLRHIAALTDLSLAQVAATTDALVTAGVVSAARPARFAHPIVGRAVYAGLAPGLRAQLHGHAAARLIDEGQPAARPAMHLLCSEPTADPLAVEVLRQAAREAAANGDLEFAQLLLERALSEPPPAATRPAVLAELGLTEAEIGRDLASAAAHLEAGAEATSERQQRIVWAVAAARARVHAGELTAGTTRLRTLRAQLRGEQDRLMALQLLAQEAAIGILAPPVAADALAELERYRQLPGDHPAELAVLAELAAKRWLDGLAGQAVGYARRALAAAVLLSAYGPDAIPFNHALAVLVDADRFDLAYPVLDQAERLAGDYGSLRARANLSGQRVVAAWREGQVTATAARARETLALLERAPVPVAAPAHRAYLCAALVERCELDEARLAISCCGEDSTIPALTYMGMPFVARARLHLARRRPDAALGDLLELRVRESQLSVRHMRNPWRREAVQACLAIGQRALARELANEQVAMAKRWRVPSALGIASSTLGLVEGGSKGIALLERGVTMLARSPARLDHARALLDLGEALRRGGQRVAARQPLRQAVELAGACGSTLLAEQARAELLVAGARPRRLQFSGVGALTPGELRVASMAAAGRSNREIATDLCITVRTVENHLARTYRKLGIGSRSQLAAALAAKGG